MTEIKNLYEKIDTEKQVIRKYKSEILDIPKYVSDNLKYDFFDRQKNSFENLLIYEADHKLQPTHLMFNMATGTGKTLLMASTILFYYKQGYRHFIFFVNQNNIIDKTENNFIEKNHNKYLFKDKIVIDDKTVEIKKVDNFSDNPQNIEIKFTTIQKLYNDIHLQKENHTTLDDLLGKDIVMLADEAHHLNADTKSKKIGKNWDQVELFEVELTAKASDIEIEKKGREHTVLELIWNKRWQSKENKNILLEFTATIPENEQIAKKYSDKIVYKFGLKEFLSAWYTKEINLISSSFNKKDRILQALLFHRYRHKIALDNGISNFKPVMLFRSKTIDESKADYIEFLELTNDLKAKDFDFLKNIQDKINQTKSVYEQWESRTGQVLEYIKKKDISYSTIAQFIKDNFKENVNCIITNSKTNKTKIEKTNEDQEKLLNNLEDKNNHIRAIFTVDRLTEWWDVLNLFDIVRLYEGRDEGKDKIGNRKAGSSTIAEKQLIGRWVRYFPFAYQDTLKNKRKFDENLKHELRALEELYFYSTNDHRYIDELKRELKKDWYIRDDKIIKTFRLKKWFQESDFYKNTKVRYNEQEDNPERRKKVLEDIEKDFFVPYKIKWLELNEQEIDFENKEDLERLNLTENWLHTITLKFKDIEKHILRKALNIKAKSQNSLYQFEILKEELEIETMEDLTKDDIFGAFDVKIIAQKNQEYDNIDNGDKLHIILKFLDNIFAELKWNINPKKWGEFKSWSFDKFFWQPKVKSIEIDQESERIEKELQDNKWYVLDAFHWTSEEKWLIDFIKNTIGNLESKYNEVYLLRNEEVYKIYDFNKGRWFQPDFILFLKDKKKHNLYYQVFIEPKGDDRVSNDDSTWKDDFLKEITLKYWDKNVLKFESKEYNLIGLPLFNKENNQAFEEQYKKVVD